MTTEHVPNTVIVQQDTPNAVLITQDSPNWVNVNQDTPSKVVIEQDVANQVIIRTGGINTTSNQRHVHSQPTVSASWVITHALGGKPSVTVVDSSNTTVIGDVTYNSNTQVTVSFSVPFSGFAYLT